VLQLEAAVAGEMEARRQSNALLRDSLVQEIHSMRVGMEQKFAKNLDDTRRELETSFQAKVDSAVAREMRARESAVQTLKDDFRAAVSASEESTQSALAAEAKKRAEGDGALRELIKETQGSVLSETRLLLQVGNILSSWPPTGHR
jgi:septal ring-binding cell division protein DamX